MKIKKSISLLLSIILILSAFAPISVFADGNPVITVQSVAETAGSTVNISVTIKNNPGILGATLKFTYDDNLTLLNASSGDAFSALTMTKPGNFSSPCNFVWDGQDLNDDDIKDGNVITLKFAVDENTAAGTKCMINVSYDSGDIVDRNLSAINPELVNGCITVIDYLPGDLNSDRKINSTDIIMLRRHIAGKYEQTINEFAGDVNADGKYNSTDIIMLRRYVADGCQTLPGGYNVELKPGKPKEADCEHELTATEYKAATCTEDGNIAYWHCSKCDKYFSDENGNTVVDAKDITIKSSGHTIIVDARVEPTDTTPGKTEGQHCSVCNEILVKQETIPPLKNTYTIQYACDMVPQADDTYTYGVEKLLPIPTLDKYTFVGWSDKDGKMWKTIPVGTTGDVILYANWSSDRNKAIPVEHLSDPAIMEDSQNGLIYFSYKIGKIVNVPLYQMSEFLTANGIETEITTTKSTSQKVQTSQEMAKTLSEATTNSTSWALSNNWNSVTEVSEKYLEEHGLEKEEAETLAKNSSGSYTIGYQSGGTSGTTSASNSNFAISNNNSQHREFEHQNDKSVVSTVDHKFDAEVGASFPISVVNVNAKVGYGYENNKVTSTSKSDKYAGTNDWSNSENYSGSQSNTSSSSKSWNSASNSTNSWSDTKTNSVTSAISEMVTREYNTNNSYSLGGSESNTIGKSTITGEENKLSSTVLYDTTDITTEAVTYRTTGNTHGGYRIVLAGTLQVYAVVIYDIATSEYSVQTYSVLGDGSDNDAPKPYLDYCWEGNQFNDYQNSIIPFEVPYEVNGYVNSLVAKTDGLKFNPDNASVTKFNNDLGSKLVYVPTYIPVNNGDDTYSFTKLTSLSANLFKGDTTIKAVRLGNGITEIPDGAFEGCTNLTDIYAPNVTKIGSRAFAGCENLNSFTISEDITEIGSNAFEGVSSINAIASNVGVSQAITQSGAKNIILNISKIPDDEKSNIEFNIGNIESFELRGGGNEYPGLSITSDAQTTVLNRLAFTQNAKIPMTLSSENVTLDQVSVDCIGYALVLKADNTKLTLNRTTNSLLSSTGIAALCKNISIVEMEGSSFESGLQVMGDILVCNSYSGDDLVKFDSGELKIITDEEYENYLSTRKVSFDANGGTVGTEFVVIPYNGKFGELPTARRDYHAFKGWYTEAEDDAGERITEDSIMTSLTDMTLYAHWDPNIPSGWVKKSDMPADAQVVDTMYTYTQTYYTTSASSTLDGWNQYNSTWVWSDYGGWSDWSTNNPGESDYRQREWQQGSNWVDTSYSKDTSHYEGRWRYYHWCGTRGNTDIYTYKYNNNYQYHEMSTTYELSINRYAGGSVPEYGPYDYCGRSNLWFRGGYSNDNGDYYWEQWVPSSEWVSQGYWNYYDLWRYRDRYQIYTYYFTRSENKESSSYPSGDNISNIQEYVQYRTK